MGRILHAPSLIVCIALLLHSCATPPTMSLEEAKQVTVPMAGEHAFAPPPRRVTDITRILDQPGQFNLGITSYYTRKADAAPPENEGKQGLILFYRERGNAARELGRLKQSLDDLRIAQRYAEEAGINDPNLIHGLSLAEVYAGNVKRAIELCEQNIQQSNYFSSYARLVSFYASIGDIEAAQRTKEEGIRKHCMSGSGRTVNYWCAYMKAFTEARILEAQGKHAEAERFQREVLANHFRGKMDYYVPGMVLRDTLRLADDLLQQGRFFESEIVARDVLKASLGLGGKESGETFFAVLKISDNLAAQGRVEEAEKLLFSAIRILEASGVSQDSQTTAMVRHKYGVLLAARGDFTGAMAQFDLLKAVMQENQYLYEKSVTRSPSLLLSLLMTGRTSEAVDLITRNYERFKNVFGEKNVATAEMLALRAIAHVRMGNLPQAADDFAGSIKFLISNTGRKNYLTRQRQNLILYEYMRFLDQIRGTPLEQARGLDTPVLLFTLAEATRGQTVQSALVASSARAAETDPEIIALIRQEQDTLQQMDAIEASLLENIALVPDQQNPQLIKNLGTRLDTLRQARSTLVDEIAKRSKRYADFVNPKPPLPSTVQAYLHPGEALVSLYTLDDRTYVWAIPQKGTVRFASVAVPKKDLEKMVAALRGSLDPHPLTFHDIPVFNTGLSYELYRTLLVPVREGWKDASDLLVMVNEPLGQIPFAVLTTAPFRLPDHERLLFDRYKDVPWLIRQASITMVPTASSFLSLRMVPPGPSQRKAFVGFGDPIFSPGQSAQLAKEETGKQINNTPTIQVRGVRLSNKGDLDSMQLLSSHLEDLNRLPDTAEEIRTIATTLKANITRDVFLGKEASTSRVKAMDLSDRQIIAFATHALVPGDLDGLDQSALALSSPAVTGNREDGLLTMSDIMKLKLNADWVVLSACNTGAAEGSGAEALSGLGRAFFFAGTRAILATMYPVETTSATKLTTRLFEDQSTQREHTRAQALQRAMLDLITDPGYVDPISQKIVARYAHPFFWAPFALFGDGGKE